MLAPLPPDQDRRLAALGRYQILDTPAEARFNEIVTLASRVCEVPVALISFVESWRQWFKAETGLGACETPIDQSICSHAILTEGVFEIPDTTLDPRTVDNPLCQGEDAFRFYAGAVLRTPEGYALGTLCVLDRQPRTLTPVQRDTLASLASLVMRELELRLALKREEVLRREIDHRVKNSLASIGSIIELQASRSQSPEARDALDAVRQRLLSLVSLHEELYLAGSGDKVRLDRLLERTATMQRNLLPAAITIQTRVEPATLDSRKANAIALLVNEFVANAGKYAFPGGRQGRVSIRGWHADAGYVLECSDNGVADDVSLEALSASTGLGMRIIAASAASLPARADWSIAEPGLRLQVSMGALSRA